ncbi:MAG: cell wall-binding repeat-containing protein [Peptococcaceae bacterium]|nr:cell wall-binding repeat-containing protein [Peptococcaceae bacterium]
MQKKNKIFSLVLAIVLLLVIVFPAAVFGLEKDDSGDRIYGTDRYETALQVAKARWPNGSETVVLAPGSEANLADALTAAPLAQSKNAPILLTEKNAISATVKAYIALKTKTVYVVSGAISSSVSSELEAMNIQVIKLGGNDRYATATNIAKEITNVNGIFVTTAQSNADALSIASVAAAKGMPILLARTNNIPDVELTYLDENKDNLTHSYVIGGTTVISDTVKGLIPGEATRIFGADRYATNLEVLKAFFTTNYDKVYVANGNDNHLVDALVASTLAASTNSPIVMVNKDFNTAIQTQVINNLSPSGKVVALGGESVVSSSVNTSNYVKAEDFGVMQLSEVNGYTVGFALPNKDMVSAVEVSLYKRDKTLLAKNVSTNKLFSLSGPQFSTPFNINGKLSRGCLLEIRRLDRKHL